MVFLADLVVVAHFAFVLFVLGGGLVVIRWPWTIGLHLPAVLWGVVVELSGWICPLTPLENWLRAQAGGSIYQESFVEHYIMPVLYPTFLTRGHQIVLGAVVVAVNLLMYGWIWRRRLARRSGTVH